MSILNAAKSFIMGEDWTLVKKQKDGLMSALNQTPPGACISIKNPGDRIMARAIIELLQEQPNELEMMDYGFEVTLMRKHAMVKSVGATYNELKENFSILDGAAVRKLGLHKSHALPAHKYRNGVPDDVNETGGGKSLLVKADGTPWES